MKTIIINNRQNYSGATGLAVEKKQGLGAELRSQLKGEVRFDSGSRALYATDGSNYRHKINNLGHSVGAKEPGD